MNQLGSIPFSLPSVGFGAMTFGARVDRPEARSMVDVCLEAGVTMFDTANSYTEGRSEQMLGEALGARRKDVLIASKVGSQVDRDPSLSGLGRDAILRSAEQSLQNLGTDYLDLFYFHRPDPGTSLHESMEAATELVASGKVRAIAVSNYSAWEMMQQQCIAEKEGFAAPVAAQMMYNLLARRIEDEYAPFAERLGIGTLVYNPLAGGLLTGRYRFEDRPDEGRFTNERYQARYWHDEQFVAVERLSRIAEEAETDLRSLALRWTAQQPVVDCVLIGASSQAQLEQNLSSLREPPLPAEVLDQCDDVWDMLRGAAPRYDGNRLRR